MTRNSGAADVRWQGRSGSELLPQQQPQGDASGIQRKARCPTCWVGGQSISKPTPINDPGQSDAAVLAQLQANYPLDETVLIAYINSGRAQADIVTVLQILQNKDRRMRSVNFANPVPRAFVVGSNAPLSYAYDTAEGEKTLPVHSLARGSYLMQFSTGKGEVIHVQKIEVQ